MHLCMRVCSFSHLRLEYLNLFKSSVIFIMRKILWLLSIVSCLYSYLFFCVIVSFIIITSFGGLIPEGNFLCL